MYAMNELIMIYMFNESEIFFPVFHLNLVPKFSTWFLGSFRKFFPRIYCLYVVLKLFNLRRNMTESPVAPFPGNRN